MQKHRVRHRCAFKHSIKQARGCTFETGYADLPFLCQCNLVRCKIADNQDLAALMDSSFDFLQQLLEVNAATVPAGYSGYRPCISVCLVLKVCFGSPKLQQTRTAQGWSSRTIMVAKASGGVSACELKL